MTDQTNKARDAAVRRPALAGFFWAVAAFAMIIIAAEYVLPESLKAPTATSGCCFGCVRSPIESELLVQQLRQFQELLIYTELSASRRFTTPEISPGGPADPPPLPAR